MSGPGGLPGGDWFRRMADDSAIVFFVMRVEPDLAYEFINDAVETQLGIPAAEALADATAVLSRIDPDHAERFAEALTLAPGDDAVTELAWRHRDGRPVYTRIWYRCQRRDDGSVAIEDTVRDITRLHEAESELSQSEERHRLLAENAWDVVWTMGLDGRVTYVSPAVMRVRGFSPEEAMNQSVDDIHPPASAAGATSYNLGLAAAIAAGEVPPVFRGEREYYRKDGSIMTAELQVIPHVDADGHMIELLGVTRDISERKQFEAELRKSEERSRLLAENAWDVIWTMAMDTTITYVSPAVERVRGLTVEEAMSESLADALTPESAVEAVTYIQQLFEAMEAGTEPPVFHGELDFYRKDGSIMTSDVQVIPHVDADGRVVEMLGVSRDISERKQFEAELRQSEERTRLMAENAWEIIWTADANGAVTYVSPAVERVRGVTVEQAMRQPLEEICPAATALSVRSYFGGLHAAIRDGSEPPVFREEHEMYRGDGSTMVVEIQIIPHLDESRRVVEIIGVTRDISERNRFEAELKRLAVTDAVTGVWNRRHGEELLAAEMSDARETGRPLSLLMLDIDHFKSINDRYGHQAGDHVLIDISHRLQASLPSTDMVARWGGEEFVVLLRGCHVADAMALAEKIRARISDAEFDDAGPATVSIGVAELTADDDLDSWLARADEALYKAKRSGRNAVRSY
jgi:diguanylate cyclase (GGDEF)-like protein/PAS domain S-box-containing protein